MSRFEHTVTTVNDKTKLTRRFLIAYGYDNPCKEYFFQIYDLNEGDQEEPILWEGTRMTEFDRDKLYYILKIMGVPDEHLKNIPFNEPF